MQENTSIKYYELWASLQADHRFFKLILFSLSILIVLMLFVLFLVARKPPAVVFVSDLGEARFIKDYRNQNQKVSEAEIRYFVKAFLGNYIAPNSERINDQMAQAINVMTKAFQQIHVADIQKNNPIERIIQAKIKTGLSFKKIDITEDNDKYISVEVVGTREISSLNSLQSDPKREGFRSQFRLLHVTRTELTPNGLLVDDFRNEIISIVTVEEGREVQIPLPDGKE